MVDASPRRLRILARPARSNRESNPYNALLYREVERAGATVTEYHPHRAALGRWDVVHVHWPESVFNHTLAEALPTTESLLFATRRAKARGAKLLWTAHNLAAHERKHTFFEERFWRLFVDELDGFVALTDAGRDATRERFPALRRKPAWVVPHPHYRGQYPDGVDRATARAELGIPLTARVLLSFGRLYEYKDVPALLRAFRASSAEDWVVLVAGRPKNGTLEHQVRREGRGDSRVRLHLRFIREDEAQRFFRAADLVVQPYREILNSGTALLALSFDRPVLLPARGAGSELQRVIGAPWVQVYSRGLDAGVLSHALDTAASLPERTDGSHLAALDATNVGQAMLRVFQELVTA